MSQKKVVVVFGATGKQGGSVVKTLLGDPKFKESWTVRGVTRDVTKPSAKALESLGAETIAADLNDASTLKKALNGAYAVFAVTNYWESASAAVELKQGKAIADAAKEAGVQHLIWSSLLHVTELTKGVLPNVEHFDSKADVEKYIRQSGLPATFFLAGFFMSNLPGGMLRPGEDGAWALTLPIPASSPVPLFAAEEDTGKFVKGILLNREKTLGKRVLGATDYYTLSQIVEEFKELYPEAGKTAKAVELPHAVYKDILQKHAGMSEHIAQEMLENMRLMNEFGYFGGESLDESHSILVDKLTTWKEFARKSPAFAELK